jgi:hypothetical protein
MTASHYGMQRVHHSAIQQRYRVWSTVQRVRSTVPHRREWRVRETIAVAAANKCSTDEDAECTVTVCRRQRFNSRR